MAKIIKTGEKETKKKKEPIYRFALNENSKFCHLLN